MLIKAVEVCAGLEHGYVGAVYSLHVLNRNGWKLPADPTVVDGAFGSWLCIG